MKCNEARPECSHCQKSSLECVWPSLNLSLLPHGSDFKVRKTPKKIGTDFIFYEQPRKSDNLEVPRDFDTGSFFSREPLPGQFTQFDPAEYKASEYPRVTELMEQPILELPLLNFLYLSDSHTLPYDEEYILENHEQQLSLSLTPLSGLTNWMPALDYTPDDTQFFHAFVHGFLPAISPQNCHPQIAPIAVFLPQGSAEPIMREVFYACGAAFMAGINPELQLVLKRRYITCVSKFNQRLAANQGRIKEWMVSTALLFALRDKFTGSTPEMPALHLSTAIQLIRILRAQYGDQSVTIKFFVESFLFNYSMVLITADQSIRKMLPSPFEIFEEWRPAFDYKPFRCFVPWQNNPVFGAATQAFELAAKASWLVSKCPLSDEDMGTACDLLLETYRMKRPVIEIQPDVQISARQFLLLQESVAVSDVSKYACQLLLLRMMTPELELLHHIIRQRVLQLMKTYKLISLDTQLWATCAWLLLVTGLSSVEMEDRSFILDMCYRHAKVCHAAFLGQIALFMELAWGTAECPGEGWNLLFNSAAVKSICL